MKCDRCGADIPAYNTFCPNCGQICRVIIPFSLFQEPSITGLIAPGLSLTPKKR